MLDGEVVFLYSINVINCLQYTASQGILGGAQNTQDHLLSQGGLKLILNSSSETLHTELIRHES